MPALEGNAMTHLTTQKQLAPPCGVLECIQQLPVPCHETIEWSKWPKPFIDEVTGGVASVFGRLVLLGTFVDRQRQLYIVPLSGSLCQCQVITDVIRGAHTGYLMEWLDMSLEQKIRDVALYLESVEERAPLVRRAIMDCRAGDILPLGSEMFSDHLLADTKLSVALLQTLALKDRQPETSPRHRSLFHRFIRLFSRRRGAWENIVPADEIGI
jgi:hypothetical protein